MSTLTFHLQDFFTAAPRGHLLFSQVYGYTGYILPHLWSAIAHVCPLEGDDKFHRLQKLLADYPVGIITTEAQAYLFKDHTNAYPRLYSDGTFTQIQNFLKFHSHLKFLVIILPTTGLTTGDHQQLLRDYPHLRIIWIDNHQRKRQLPGPARHSQAAAFMMNYDGILNLEDHEPLRSAELIWTKHRYQRSGSKIPL